MKPSEMKSWADVRISTEPTYGVPEILNAFALCVCVCVRLWAYIISRGRVGEEALMTPMLDGRGLVN